MEKQGWSWCPAKILQYNTMGIKNWIEPPFIFFFFFLTNCFSMPLFHTIINGNYPSNPWRRNLKQIDVVEYRDWCDQKWSNDPSDLHIWAKEFTSIQVWSPGAHPELLYKGIWRRAVPMEAWSGPENHLWSHQFRSWVEKGSQTSKHINSFTRTGEQ